MGVEIFTTTGDIPEELEQIQDMLDKRHIPYNVFKDRGILSERYMPVVIFPDGSVHEGCKAVFNKIRNEKSYSTP